MVAKGKAWGKRKKAGISSCEALYIEWINEKVLLYSTENYDYPMINHNGKNRDTSFSRQEPAVCPFAWQSDKAILFCFIQKKH